MRTLIFWRHTQCQKSTFSFLCSIYFRHRTLSEILEYWFSKTCSSPQHICIFHVWDMWYHLMCCACFIFTIIGSLPRLEILFQQGLQHYTVLTQGETLTRSNGKSLFTVNRIFQLTDYKWKWYSTFHFSVSWKTFSIIK